MDGKPPPYCPTPLPKELLLTELGRCRWVQQIALWSLTAMYSVFLTCFEHVFKTHSIANNPIWLAVCIKIHILTKCKIVSFVIKLPFIFLRENKKHCCVFKIKKKCCKAFSYNWHYTSLAGPTAKQFWKYCYNHSYWEEDTGCYTHIFRELFFVFIAVS